MTDELASAFDTVDKLIDGFWDKETVRGHPVTKAFAQFIAYGPVTTTRSLSDDAILNHAREMVAIVNEDDDFDNHDFAQEARDGKQDGHEEVIIAVASIKRGLEIARGEYK